jgi:hypothetical protein
VSPRSPGEEGDDACREGGVDQNVPGRAKPGLGGVLPGAKVSVNAPRRATGQCLDRIGRQRPETHRRHVEQRNVLWLRAVGAAQPNPRIEVVGEAGPDRVPPRKPIAFTSRSVPNGSSPLVAFARS